MTHLTLTLLILQQILLAAIPSAAAVCVPGQWNECRTAFQRALFDNRTSVPPRVPDFILKHGGPRVSRLNNGAAPYTMVGLPGPGNGTGVGNVSWSNNLTALVWTIRGPFLDLNSTVLYSLNTSSRAPANYNPPPYGSTSGRNDNNSGASSTGPNQPHSDAPWGESDGYYPTGIGDTLVIYHNGHETTTCTPNYDGVVDRLNRLGYDVMEMMMPLIGCNTRAGLPTSHAYFETLERRGDNGTLRYFIEPVALAASYAKRVLGYKHVAMVGLSGGGWTTTLSAAAVTDIDLSIPVAGSVPKWPTPAYNHWVPDLPEGRNRAAVSPNIFYPQPLPGAGGDYEQEQARSAYAHVGGYAEMYVLATLPGGGDDNTTTATLPASSAHGSDYGARTVGYEQSETTTAAGRGAQTTIAASAAAAAAATTAGEAAAQSNFVRLGGGRHQLQILHEYDSCCFRGAGLLSDIRAYNEWAQEQIANVSSGSQMMMSAGWFQTVVTAGNYHEVNERDMVLVSYMLERLRRRGWLTKSDFELLPFDDLRMQ